MDSPQHHMGSPQHSPPQHLGSPQSHYVPEPKQIKQNFGTELFHRPRGQGGKWLKIEEGERVRVSPSTGKNLRMIVCSLFPFEEKDLVIIPKNIIDDKVYERGTDSIQIITFHGSVKQTDGYYDTQVDLKLFLQGQMMKLLVEVTNANDGNKFSACTVQFSTHNSGKTNNSTTKRKREDSFNTPPTDINITTIKEEPMKRQKVNDMGQYQVPSVFQNAQVMESDLDVIGIIRARAFYQYSDIRLKTNIEDIVDAMYIITSLSGKRYEWKEGVPFEDNGNKVIGLMAQEVQKVAPEVVKEMPDGYLSVNYAELVPVVISAFNQHFNEYSIYKEEVGKYIQDLQNNLEVLTNKDQEIEKNKELLEKKYNELQQIVSNMKKDIDMKRSKSEAILRKRRTQRRHVVPIAILVFVVVVLCSALGILMVKIFDGNTTAPVSTDNSKEEKTLNPVFATGDATNLVYNPSFEEVESGTNKLLTWESTDTYDLLTESGERRNNIVVFPFHGTNALRLTLSDERESVTVTQTILIEETPKAFNISGYANSEHFTTSSSFVPFMVTVEANFKKSDNTLTKSLYTTLFSTTNRGWQFNYNFVESFPSDGALYAVHVSCSISRGVGSVYFDNIALTFHS